jgi:phospholipid/cholesterol/gamma-HCH transport system ATP-binding protein
MNETPRIEVRGLEVAYGAFVVLRDVNFRVQRGEIFVIMGGSGCGKSSLLRRLIGLEETDKGEILLNGRNRLTASPEERVAQTRKFGVLFQAGALWSSMTVAENVALPLEQSANLSPPEVAELVRLKLAWVGLKGFEEFYPAQLSGGMVKRAGLARAMALDPEILFFDEPTGGLDPVAVRRLNKLILQLRDNLGTTVVMVTHEVASIFAVTDNAIFLNAQTRTLTASGSPRQLLQNAEDPAVREFLSRGESAGAAAA